jgi:hypothetical protein
LDGAVAWLPSLDGNISYPVTFVNQCAVGPGQAEARKKLKAGLKNLRGAAAELVSR